jgi:hypothetical protein
MTGSQNIIKTKTKANIYSYAFQELYHTILDLFNNDFPTTHSISSDGSRLDEAVVVRNKVESKICLQEVTG